MFDIKNIVNRIRDRGRESNPDSPAHGKEDAVGSRQAAEGLLCPSCMEAFTSVEALRMHYESSHAELLDSTVQPNDGRFETLHEEIGEKCSRQDGHQVVRSNSEVDPDTVLNTSDSAELKEKLTEALKSKSWLETEKDRLEQKAAHLAKMNAALKAASDESESNQVTLRERLKVLEAQLAHRESIDDAAVLKQELVQVQRMMDELTREKEKERDMLQRDLQQLQDKYTQLEKRNSDASIHTREIEELIKQLNLKEAECSRILKKLEDYKQKAEAGTEKIIFLDSELSGQKQKLKMLQEQHEELKQSLKNKDQSFSEIIELKQKSIDESIAQLKKMKEKLEHKDKELDELKAKLKTSVEEENKTKATLAKVKQNFDSLEAEIKSRDFRIEELTSALTNSKEASAKQESERAELVAKIQAGEGAKTVIQQLTQETNSLQEKLKLFEKKEEEKNKYIQELKMQIQNVTTKYHDCMKGMETKEAELKSMESSLGSMSSNVSELQRSLEEKEMQIEELSSCIERCRLNSSKMECALSELKETVNIKFHEISVLKENNETLDKQNKELEAKLKMHKDQLMAINSEADELRDKLSQIQRSLENKEEQIHGLKTELNAKEDQIQTLATENQKLTETIEALQRTLHSNEEFIQAIGVQRTSLETDLFELQKSMAELETEKKNCEESLKTEITALSVSLHNTLADTDSLKQDLEHVSQLKEKLSEKYKDLSSAKDLEVKELKRECQKLLSEIETKESEKSELRNTLTTAERKVSKLMDDIKVSNESLIAAERAHSEKTAILQNALDEVAGEKLALEAQLEASQSEQKTLLERFFATSGEMENMRHTIIELRRKLDESQAALQELGRENQTLQLDLEKLTGRKWTEDSDAPQCAQCNKDFSMIVRRHHCRNCGQIFCNECSSKLAPVGNNKKPVRVCDNCYNEVMNK